MVRPGIRTLQCTVLAVALATAADRCVAADAGHTATGLELPRFVSLKVDRVNLRQGPGVEYPVAWVFQRAGWPVEVMKEFEGWRQIRDAEGAIGWVQGAALSGRRTVLVVPWEAKPGGATPAPVALRSDAKPQSAPTAYVEPNVAATVISCDGRWCRVSAGDVRGFVEQVKLWGVYPGEVVK